MTVVYLDPYFLGDPLFVPGLARDLAARGAGLVLVHGSGERGERALESLGRMPHQSDGVWETDDEAGRAAVEHAARELNREVVHELNEQGVASIRALAADRGLVKAQATAWSPGGRRGWATWSARASLPSWPRWCSVTARWSRRTRRRRRPRSRPPSGATRWRSRPAPSTDPWRPSGSPRSCRPRARSGVCLPLRARYALGPARSCDPRDAANRFESVVW